MRLDRDAPNKTDVAAANSPSNGRWYVVQTQPQAEYRAVANLERQGYRTFFPRLRVVVRHARTSRTKFSPLFPGYVFIHRDISIESWRSINSTFGVTRLLARGEVPEPVPHGIVEAIQVGLTNEPAIRCPSLRVGQAVRIAEGPFADICGTLEQLNPSGRVRVLLHLLGQSVSVGLRYEALASVG